MSAAAAPISFQAVRETLAIILAALAATTAAPAAARDAMMGMDMHDDAPQAMLLFDQLEYVHADTADSAFVDAAAWYGGDLDKVRLEMEGEHSGGTWRDLRTELLWDHAVAGFWDTGIGLRRDFGTGPGRTWAAFGVRGLAPWWIELEATAYVGENGRTAARLQAETEWRLSERVVLQPRFEVNLYSRDDRARDIGSGLSDAEFGLRLRYEIRRDFAPYIGVDWRRSYAATAGFERAAGGPAFRVQWVAGVRMWF